MSEFEDFIDLLSWIEQPDVNVENVIETICESNNEGELLCDTLTADNDMMTDLWSSDDGELEGINQEFQNTFESFFAPFYNALSVFNAFSPYDYVFNFDTGAEDGDLIVQLSDDGLVEVDGLDFYEDEYGEVIVVDLSDVSSNVWNFAKTSKWTGKDIDLFVEYDEDSVVPNELWYFDPSFGEIVFDYELEGEYDPYDDKIMHVKDEFAFGEAIQWHDQVLGALSFVLLALILSKVVFFCTRSRSRRASDRRTPLLTVTVDKKDTTKDGETGSYVPPQISVVKKAVVTEKLDKKPYIVFI